jgi:hypothetical protein
VDLHNIYLRRLKLYSCIDTLAIVESKVGEVEVVTETGANDIVGEIEEK